MQSNEVILRVKSLKKYFPIEKGLLRRQRRPGQSR